MVCEFSAIKDKDYFSLVFFHKNSVTQLKSFHNSGSYEMFLDNDVLDLDNFDAFNYEFNNSMTLKGNNIDLAFLREALRLGKLNEVTDLTFEIFENPKGFLDLLAQMPKLKYLDIFIDGDEERKKWADYFISIRPDVEVRE